MMDCPPCKGIGYKIVYQYSGHSAISAELIQRECPICCGDGTLTLSEWIAYRIVSWFR